MRVHMHQSRHHHHHHHISVMELGHLLTRSGLTYREVSSKVSHDFFCQLGNSVSLHWVPKSLLWNKTINNTHLFHVSVALLADTATYRNCSGDQVKKNKAGLSCSTYGGDEKCTQGSSEETAGKELEDKVKVNFALKQVTKVQMRSRSIALLLLQPRR